MSSAAQATGNFVAGAGQGIVNGAATTVTLGFYDPHLDHCPFATAAAACSAGQVGGQIGVGIAAMAIPGADEIALARVATEARAGAEAATGSARFVAGGDGAIMDLVGDAPNAVTLGRHPAYIRAAAADGSRTFDLGKAWGAMADRADRFGDTAEGSEIWIRNTRFLDQARARGSEVRLASDPFAPENAGSFFVREVEYLQKSGYRVVGDRMVAP